jgi:hypothetical protein
MKQLAKDAAFVIAVLVAVKFVKNAAPLPDSVKALLP